tara:strand:- start:106 stop:384 length:279 start_codon:yes stop_codon:yes gene_type:complete
MKNYLISELGLILQSLKDYQNKNINDNVLYKELSYTIYKTEQKIKYIQNQNNGGSPYQTFKNDRFETIKKKDHVITKDNMTGLLHSIPINED